MHHLRSEHLVVSLLLVLAAAGCDGTGSSGDADVDADADTDVDADVDTDTDAPQEWTPPAHEPVNPVPLDLASVTEDAGLFPAGVMAGDPQPDAMLLWTFATDAADLRLKVWLPGLDVLPADQVDLLHDAPVTPSPQGFVHQWVDTVVPGRRHAYAFVHGVAGDALNHLPTEHTQPA